MPRAALATVATVVTVATLTTAGCKQGTSTPDGAAAAQSHHPTATAPTSNGLASKSARVILAATAKALRSASSVHIKGTMKDDGDVVGIDMWITQRGCRGALRGPIAGKTVSMGLIAVDGTLYLRGRQLWLATAGTAAAQRIGDRWAAVPKSGAPAQFMSLRSFTRDLIKDGSKIVKGKPATVAGRPVITLIDTRDRSVLYVSATGKPYPLRIAEAGGKQRVNLGGYNAPVTITKPTNVARL